MKLDEYLKPMSADEILSFAKMAGTQPIYLQHIIKGHRKAGVDLIAGIYFASGGKITIEDLRPDAWAIARKTARRNTPKPLRKSVAA